MFYVYAITNSVNGKKYIGITNDITRRFRQHKSQLKYGKHPNVKLQRAYNKYGQDKFDFSVLEELECSKKELADREIYYISKYDSCDNGYNLTYGGDNYGNNVITEKTKQLLRTVKLGYKESEETKKRKSIAMKNCSDMEERKKRSSKILRDLWKTKEFREKMAKLNKGNTYTLGHHMSEEQKSKLSEMRKGEKNPFYGKSHTDETKQLLSEKSKNRWMNSEFVEKVSINRNKVMQSEEYRHKQSLFSQGRSKKTSELDAITIRYRYLCGEKPRFILKDYPKLTNSGLLKICHNTTWKHLPNTKEELYNMLINYQSKEESLEGLETR